MITTTVKTTRKEIKLMNCQKQQYTEHKNTKLIVIM